MSYDTERSKEQLRRFETPIGNFIGRYRKQRPTFILFPGGMGSQLTRATEPFHHDLRRFDYATVWLDWTILDDAANQMQMHGDEDSDENIIISDGALSLFGFTPYDRFLAWCDEHHINWFVFGWDWRHRLECTVAFFSRNFLPTFRKRVMDASGGEILYVT